jgi:hypothetical protein
MLKSRMAQASVVAGALILAMIGPAMAAGGPGDAGAGQGGPAAGAGMGAGGGNDVGAAARPENPGGGGGKPDNPGGGGGKPDNPGGGGGKPDNPGGGGGKPGGETAGNNLSFPVQWSESAYSVTVPGTEGLVTILGEVLPGYTGTEEDETRVPCLGAVQKDSLNSWRADSALVTPNVVTTIDWGDNLESKDWKLGGVVRVETGLYDSVLAAAMTRYEMCYISGSGTDEVWGLRVTGTPGAYTAVELESPEAMVYTAGARLTIQQIVPGGTYAWDPVTHAWTGAGAGDPVFNMAAWQRTTDGPESYGAELNVGGKIVYGYNWRTSGLTAGEYRLTFSLDGAESTFAGSGAAFDATTAIRSEAVITAEDEGDGNTAHVVPTHQLTYIDVGLS